HLDGDGLRQKHVHRFVDCAHAAFADLARQAIAVGERVPHQRVDDRRLWALVVHRCLSVKKITPPAMMIITIAIHAQPRPERAGSSSSSLAASGGTSAGFFADGLLGDRSICTT